MLLLPLVLILALLLMQLERQSLQRRHHARLLLLQQHPTNSSSKSNSSSGNSWCLVLQAGVGPLGRRSALAGQGVERQQQIQKEQLVLLPRCLSHQGDSKLKEKHGFLLLQEAP